MFEIMVYYMHMERFRPGCVVVPAGAVIGLVFGWGIAGIFGFNHEEADLLKTIMAVVGAGYGIQTVVGRS